MVNIDFQGGMHGNYLEFICNKFLAGIDIKESLPFNELGAAHSKTYLKTPWFLCDHFSTWNKPLDYNKVICITLTPEDLLPVQCVSLLRAGDYNIDPGYLEKDTYHKLNNDDYHWVLDNIIEHYFKNQIVESYRSVMDESWPMIYSLREFESLPEHIKQECIDQHGLLLHEFSKDSPDCPRYILRDFFKKGFKQPQIHGFLTQQKKFQYHESVDVYDFPFDSFYDFEKFNHQIQSIGKWLGLSVQGDIGYAHDKFLTRQKFKDTKKQCDDLIKKIIAGERVQLPNLSVIEEAYIDAQFEKIFDCEMPLNERIWFSDADEVRRYFKFQ